MISKVFTSCGSIMEWWSNGVMKEPIQVGNRAFAFSNTPVLQYSKNSSQFLPAKPLNSDLALRIRFSILNKI
jgi:hypothetical protein